MKEVVLVTGASSPLGRSCADYLSRSGYRVYRLSRGGPVVNGGNDRNSEDWEVNVPSEEGMGEGDTISGFIVDIANREGGLHAVINCAEYVLAGSVEDTTTDEARALFEANLFEVHRVCRATLPILREQRSGLIVNVSWKVAAKPTPYFGFYDATRTALEGLTLSLRAEVEPFGIGVLLVEPGALEGGSVDARVETFGARTSSVYWDSYKQTLRELQQGEAGASPHAVALLIERLIREAFLPGGDSGSPQPPWAGPALKQVHAGGENRGRRSLAGHIEAHTQVQPEAQIVSFAGSWSPEERQIVEEAVGEFEVRRRLTGVTGPPLHWVCSCRRLRGRSLYIANRTGSELVYTAQSAAELAEQVVRSTSGRSTRTGPHQT